MAKRITDEDLRLNLIINGDGGKKEMLELERQMKDFSYREFEASPTAECEGICNVITSFAVRDAVKELTERVLQPLRDKVGHPLRINSGYRCPELNRMVGGVPTSQHVKGEAADIAAADPFLLAKVVRNTPEIWKEVDQMILYPTFVQGKLCDVPDNVFRENARWNQPRTVRYIVLPYHYLRSSSSTYVQKTIHHEYGHTRQSLYLGWLYLLIIGLPSITWAWLHSSFKCFSTVSYYDFYTEKWADWLGGVKR